MSIIYLLQYSVSVRYLGCS